MTPIDQSDVTCDRSKLEGLLEDIADSIESYFQGINAYIEYMDALGIDTGEIDTLTSAIAAVYERQILAFNRSWPDEFKVSVDEE